MIAAIPRGWLAAMLLLIPIGMACLGFVVFPPLYSLWCKVTGTQVSPSAAVDPSLSALPAVGARPIEVIFNQRANELPVRFWAERRIVTALPGETVANVFHFVNLSDRTVRFRPIHSVSPAQANQGLVMKLCFCFNDQEIAPGASRDFPVELAFAPTIGGNVTQAYITFILLPLEPADG